MARAIENLYFNTGCVYVPRLTAIPAEFLIRRRTFFSIFLSYRTINVPLVLLLSSATLSLSNAHVLLPQFPRRKVQTDIFIIIFPALGEHLLTPNTRFCRRCVFVFDPVPSSSRPVDLNYECSADNRASPFQNAALCPGLLSFLHVWPGSSRFKRKFPRIPFANASIRDWCSRSASETRRIFPTQGRHSSRDLSFLLLLVFSSLFHSKPLSPIFYREFRANVPIYQFFGDLCLFTLASVSRSSRWKNTKTARVFFSLSFRIIGLVKLYLFFYVNR